MYQQEQVVATAPRPIAVKGVPVTATVVAEPVTCVVIVTTLPVGAVGFGYIDRP